MQCATALHENLLVQTAVGHYGVFSDRHWTNEIYPLVRDVIHFND
jgi:poly(3-hydroxybutyrate) depolymerase